MTEPAANVIEALIHVARDLPAIGKDSNAAPQQGGYAYRGIEAITKHTQTLFAKHGVVFTPHVRSYEVRDIEVGGKPWTDVYELIEYTVYGPGGADDSITVGPILAIGRDNSDKGANKCMTQAFKYALLQALCISDAKDDGDHSSVEADERPVEIAPTAAKKTILARIERAEIADAKDHAAEVWRQMFGDEKRPITQTEWDELCDATDRHIEDLKAMEPEQDKLEEASAAARKAAKA